MAFPERLLFVFGGLFGLCGVAAAAAASHITGPGRLDIAANMLLFHAPALIAIALVARANLAPRGIVLASGWLVMLGAMLFSGELTMRAFWDATLFPMAAPTGGFLMMLGWAAFALIMLFSRRPLS